jgi:hypothetical protein
VSPNFAGLFRFRALRAPHEVVELLRLRHRVYFEECGYGSLRPHHHDLTAHDLRSRLFGVYLGPRLVGGLRLVFRTEQPEALVLAAVRAALQEKLPLATGDGLPSEEAFDLRGAADPLLARPDVEIGRLALLRDVRNPELLFSVMLATLTALHVAGARSYLYSCARERAARFAQVANPRLVLEQPCAEGFASDHFVFPLPTVAVLSVPSDSPYFGRACAAEAELRRSGQIVLSPAAEPRHASP